MTNQHPYAEILRAIADGKQIQVRMTSGWSNTGPHSVFNACLLSSGALLPEDYRIKPATITINGVECPAEAKTNEESQFAVDIQCMWSRTNLRLWYPTQADAEAVFAALCKPFGEVK